MENKTNVMRILDSAKAEYETYSFDSEGALSATEAAELLGKDPDVVFKTLVTVGKTGVNYVFVVPGNRELDLKKAAKSVGEKNLEMIKQKDLFPKTGYIHGGCSPIGMKKSFKTTIDESALDHEKILFSAGRIGFQIEMTLEELKKVIRYQLADITVD